MIIKKSQFKWAKKYRGQWPFTVDEVAVMRLDIEGNVCLCIIHEYSSYALSGILENHGLPKLMDSGIWADNLQIPGTKKSLTLFFEFCKNQIEDVCLKGK